MERPPLAADTPSIQSLVPYKVYGALGSSPRGLDPDEARARLERLGPNMLREAPRPSLVLKFAGHLTHTMALLLWAASIMAFIADMGQLGIAIIAVVLINAAFSFWQEFRAERATEALRRLLPAYARVLRGGAELRVLAEELVTGDLLLLAEGDNISADARLVEESELRTDNGTLTGESVPVRRTADAVLRTDISRAEVGNLVFAGTSVATGTGRAVVYATAMDTELGRIANLTQTVADEPSPIQREVARTVRWITIMAVSLGVLFFLLGDLLGGMTTPEAFIFGIGIIVAFVPEGLLPTVTLALALGVQRLAKRNVLMKKLSAVETLGSTTVICTDKTGTLTQNEMTVLRLFTAAGEYQVSGQGYEPTGAIEPLRAGGSAAAIPTAGPPQSAAQADEGDLNALLETATLCSNARLLPPDADRPRWTVLGDPTEAALRVAAAKRNINTSELEARYPRRHEYPFDSRRKRMCTLNARGSGLIAHVKGAPLEVLELCDRVLLGERVLPLDEATRARVLEANDTYAAQSLRVLAAAYRPLADGEARGPDGSPAPTADVERNLVFLGLLAMMDPPRAEVAEAVQRCHEAQIRIIMITGDYGLTARSIAQRLGIARPDRTRVVSGVELGQLTAEQLQRLLQDSEDVIFARVSPEDKLRVVSELKALGEVVAVTGDGVNDAPALRRADIGVAMGISGTDVAKEAADMILTDDNFASIVNAVEEGRAVYANMKKFTTYIFASNVPEAVPFLAFAFSGGRIPLALTVMQILAVDLGTDLVPALGLGSDLPEPGIMQGPPRSQRAHLIDLPLLARAYLWLGPIEALLAMAAFYWVYWTRGFRGVLAPLPDETVAPLLYATATTATLAGIVTSQVGNVFACRSLRSSITRIGWLSNRLVLLGIASELTLMAAIAYLGPLQRLFGTAPLRTLDWVVLLSFGPLLLLFEEGRKWLARHARVPSGRMEPAGAQKAR